MTIDKLQHWLDKGSRKNIANNELDLTICLPLQLSRTDGQPIHLAFTSDFLQNTQWKLAENSQAFTEEIEQQQAQCLFQNYQRNAYFHPFVRRFLLNSDRVCRFYRDDIDSITVELEQYSADSIRVELSAKKCELVLFQPNIAIFVLQLKNKEYLSLKTIQQLQDSLRRLYPPYFYQKQKDKEENEKYKVWYGGHCPVDVNIKFKNNHFVSSNIYQLADPTKFLTDYHIAIENLSKIKSSTRDKAQAPLFKWADHWQALLHPLSTLGQDNIQIQHLGDDRAPILSWIALDDIHQVSAGDWMRLCFADEPGSNALPYAGVFMQDFDKNYCYDRYWYAQDESSLLPSRILNCGYTFSYVGSVKDSFFTNKKNGAYFTYENIYMDMAIIAHFQRSALLIMSNELSELVHRDRTTGKISLPKRKDVLDFYNKFVEFTQNYWFDEISPQEQGIEMFEMWRKQLRIQSLYDEIHQELKDLVEYSELRATEDLNNKLTKLTIAGFVVAIISVYIAVFSMDKYVSISFISSTVILGIIGFYLGTKIDKEK